MSSENEYRQALIHKARYLNEVNLTRGRSGNLSVRFQDDFLITPSGIPNADLTADDIVLMNTADGFCQSGQLKPSSEWPVHQAIYKAYPQANAIIHAHSDWATALACTGRDIPGFHYMIAMVGGDSIRCAPYAIFGSEQLSAFAVEALKDRKACLLGNHGQLVYGDDLDEAFEIAELVESLAHQYCITLQLGDPVILGEQEMQGVLAQFGDYGHQ